MKLNVVTRLSLTLLFVASWLPQCAAQPKSDLYLCGELLPSSLVSIRKNVEQHFKRAILCQYDPKYIGEAGIDEGKPTIRVSNVSNEQRTGAVIHELMHLQLRTEGFGNLVSPKIAGFGPGVLEAINRSSNELLLHRIIDPRLGKLGLLPLVQKPSTDFDKAKIQQMVKQLDDAAIQHQRLFHNVGQLAIQLLEVKYEAPDAYSAQLDAFRKEKLDSAVSLADELARLVESASLNSPDDLQKLKRLLILLIKNEGYTQEQ